MSTVAGASPGTRIPITGIRSAVATTLTARPFDVVIVRLAQGDEHIVLAGGELFDAAPTEATTARFLSSDDHHLLVALDADSDPVGVGRLATKWRVSCVTART